MATKTAVPCPLGESCPYKKGNKIPNHYTTSATYKLHESLAKKSKDSGVSPSKVVDDFMSERTGVTESEVSDAKMRSDGTVSFAGLGKGKKWFEAQKTINKAMSAEIKAGTKAIVQDPEKLKEFTDFVLSNYTLSYGNMRLIKLQRKLGSVFRTQAQWEEEGYELQPGAGYAMVRRPLFKKVDALDAQGNKILDADGNPKKTQEMIGFKFYNVYSDRDLDASVKAPPRHPLVEHYEKQKHRTDITVPEAFKEDITSVAQGLGIGVKYVDKSSQSTLASGAYGFARKEDGAYKIYIDSSLSVASQVSTFAHEMGHIMCGHLSDDESRSYAVHRGDMEAEAEIFAYSLCKDYDLDISDSTFTYLKGWSTEDDSQIDRALENSSKAMAKYYARLEKIKTGTDQHEAIKAVNEKVSEKYKDKKAGKK